MYQKLPFYLEKVDAEMRARYSVWDKLLTDTIPWKQNMGNLMRLVMVEKSPVLRQEARPSTLSEDPLRDIFNVRERTAEARLHWHEFVSPHFRFQSSFEDFLKGNLIPTRKNIEEQIRIYADMFYRTHIWDNSPNVYFAGVGAVAAPVGTTGVGSAAVSNKTAAWIQSNLANADFQSGRGGLTFAELFKALNTFESDIGATPYEGTGQPGGDSMPLNERYCLVCSPEAWNQFVDDEWLKENRQINMNIVTEAFRGDIWGKIRAKLEKYPRRFSVDEDFLPTSAAPETSVVDPESQDYGRTIPGPSYASITGSPIEVAWLVGGKHYRRIGLGPPPQFFAGGTGDPQKLAGMNWNGQVYHNKNFLIPCVPAGGGDPIMRMNEFGHYVRFQAELGLGIVGPHAFNIMPIVFKRRVGITTVLP
jgi:hypothetical protein